MGYEVALKKSWEDLANLKAPKNLSVKFLADEHSIDAAEDIVVLAQMVSSQF